MIDLSYYDDLNLRWAFDWADVEEARAGGVAVVIDQVHTGPRSLYPKEFWEGKYWEAQQELGFFRYLDIFDHWEMENGRMEWPDA
jgi:hypothetical protein